MGVKEYQQSDKKHLPEKLDPIDRTQFSKEWLEHVIGNIRPRLSNVVIHPVSISSGVNQAVYVVEISQSIVPHQALDHKYYRRYNFESAPMDDYEINDVRNRQNQLEKLINFDVTLKHTSIVFLTVENLGTVPALNVNFHFSPELNWRKEDSPPLFAKGAKVFPPKRTYSFFYQSYIDIVNKEEIPTNFDLEISYEHPQNWSTYYRCVSY